MPISTDDFDSWQSRDSPHPSGARRDHPHLSNVDTEGMPTFARLRLQDHIRNGRAPFTSNLSVGELLLMRRVGYLPVAQVIGASVYHVGQQFLPTSIFMSSGEMYMLTDARAEAWSNALARLAQQAHVAGTHIVTGVEVTCGAQPGQDEPSGGDAIHADVLEVSLIGTAARYGGAINTDKPLLSTLSAEDFIKLYAAGYFPVGIAYGCCVYYQASRWSAIQGTRSVVASGTQWTNQEITDYSEAYMRARKTAVERMNETCRQMGGEQVAGITSRHGAREIERDIHQYENERKQVGVIIIVEAYGTAISHTAPKAHTTTTPSLPLTD